MASWGEDSSGQGELFSRHDGEKKDVANDAPVQPSDDARPAEILDPAPATDTAGLRDSEVAQPVGELTEELDSACPLDTLDPIVV